jgi:RNA polymerase sigma factor (sigma-70 family)|tara:strand:+ start:1434 stop:2192 length:759 start_codon:yes stop_codon:yes gene_type:complete
MKKYNIQNYIRYKNDVKACQPKAKELDQHTQKELIHKFLPLVENIGRKFSTSQQASGVMSIMDIMQEGNLSLIKAVRRIDWIKLNESDDIEKTLKSFLSKRIKGGIRRAIDINRGDMRIPEHKLNEIRRNAKDEKMVAMFFNSMFLSIDDKPKNTDDEENMIYQIADKSVPYNIGLLNIYLTGLLRKHLNEREYEVLRLSYGLDCDKHSANKIAEILNIEGSSAYVRVSELKKQAVDKLISSVDHSQVLDYL